MSLTSIHTDGTAAIVAERLLRRAAGKLCPGTEDQQRNNELIWAAMYYASPVFLNMFPWAKKFDDRSKLDRIQQLSRAGALIAAEIDRLSKQTTTRGAAA
jgi:hypothetical protein